MPWDSETAYLDTTPPHLAARGLAYVTITLFLVAIVVALLVQVPETVSGRFMLVPRDGADPVRALKEGVVSEVRVHEGDVVARNTVLMVIRSAPLSDRFSEKRTLENQRRTDEAEEVRLKARVTFLEQLIASRQHRATQTRALADSALAGMRTGSVARLDATRLDIEASTLVEDVQVATNDLVDTRAAVARLTRDEEARDLEYRETKRGLAENIETARIRIGALQGDLVNLTDAGLVILAPCEGTVLRLRVGSPGAIVSEGEILSELACVGHRLEAEFSLPQSGVPMVRPGQQVKLRFDAFPYQRFGVHFGTVRWLGPTGMMGGDSTAFRALIDLRGDSIRVRGQPRPLLAGMGGLADVVVGRRSLVSYAVEPIRALRENLADTPPP
jgi:membrane fusion protein